MVFEVWTIHKTHIYVYFQKKTEKKNEVWALNMYHPSCELIAPASKMEMSFSVSSLYS